MGLFTPDVEVIEQEAPAVPEPASATARREAVNVRRRRARGGRSRTILEGQEGRTPTQQQRAQAAAPQPAASPTRPNLGGLRFGRGGGGRLALLR